MKEVLAVIRMNKMNQTKQALADAGISAFHARPVYGRGRGQVDFRVLEGAKDGHPEAIAQLGNGPRGCSIARMPVAAAARMRVFVGVATFEPSSAPQPDSGNNCSEKFG